MVKLFYGIFTGLGVPVEDVSFCVDEGAATIEKLEEAFQEFEKRQVYFLTINNSRLNWGIQGHNLGRAELAALTVAYFSGYLSCVRSAGHIS